MHHRLRLIISNGRKEFESTRKEFIAFAPITIEDKNLYMFVSGIPGGEVDMIRKKDRFRFS